MNDWYRVVDPLNPLNGCDVKLGDQLLVGDLIHYEVIALRRIDILLGDRPYQLVAKPGNNLGITIAAVGLVEASIQDDVIEVTTELPHGKVIDESEMAAGDRTLHVVHYERATQIALRESGRTLATRTVSTDERDSWEYVVVGHFQLGEPTDDIVSLVRNYQ